MIENERNPSWVPLVTLFLPVGDSFYGFSTLCAGGKASGVSFPDREMGLRKREPRLLEEKRRTWNAILKRR